MFQTGLVSVTLKHLEPKQVVTLAQKAALQSIEWSEGHHIDPHDLQTGRTIGDMSRDAQIDVLSYGSYYYLGEKMDGYPSLLTASVLQAKVIRIWAGKTGSASVETRQMHRMIEEAKAFCRQAMDCNITVALEWHANTITDTASSALQFLTEVDEPNLKTLWQPHPHQTHEERLAELPEILPYLEYVHVYHWKQKERKSLEEGAQEWEDYLKILHTSQRERALMLEFVTDDDSIQFLEDAQTLRRLISMTT